MFIIPEDGRICGTVMCLLLVIKWNNLLNINRQSLALVSDLKKKKKAYVIKLIVLYED